MDTKKEPVSSTNQSLIDFIELRLVEVGFCKNIYGVVAAILTMVLVSMAIVPGYEPDGWGTFLSVVLIFFEIIGLLGLTNLGDRNEITRRKLEDAVGFYSNKGLSIHLLPLAKDASTPCFVFWTSSPWDQGEYDEE